MFLIYGGKILTFQRQCLLSIITSLEKHVLFFLLSFQFFFQLRQVKKIVNSMFATDKTY